MSLLMVSHTEPFISFESIGQLKGSHKIQVYLHNESACTINFTNKKSPFSNITLHVTRKFPTLSDDSFKKHTSTSSALIHHLWVCTWTGKYLVRYTYRSKYIVLRAVVFFIIGKRPVLEESFHNYSRYLAFCMVKYVCCLD